MENIFGFSAAVAVGITLGLIGGGGSILTVPILVYIFSIDPLLSTSYSLFVVGLTALIGAYGYFKKNEVELGTAVLFSIPSLISVYFTRRFLMPAIPDVLTLFEEITVTKNFLILIVFALLMIGSAYSMIKKSKLSVPGKEIKRKYLLIIVEGIIVGVLTGFVGAGGGFLIIPALVVFAKLPMKKAVGTSLIVIALKSFFGFIGDAGTDLYFDWGFLLLFSLFAAVGIVFGLIFSKRISGEKLKPAFGWFVLLMGTYIMFNEIRILIN
ncbi:MAG: sulfite exporter TauE/SafE family protein [Melioribacteraceae bacterium]|nr:sulfite exporter TauE/SafE family protein [Melioribacteraceae bacterium]